MIPSILTIAGSDSGGGAGIQADLKTFSALQTYGASVITAVTAQNTRSVSMAQTMPSALIRAQIEAVLDDLTIAAVKIGMLGSPDVIAVVSSALKGCGLPIVLDPVMVAKSGDRLLSIDALDALKSELLPLCHVLTPNLPEAADLLGLSAAKDEAEQRFQGQALRMLGPQWVLMKGGHAEGRTCTDILIGDTELILKAPRVETKNTHGTGCTLSAAIAAGIGKGLSVTEAVKLAHQYLQGAITTSHKLSVGLGNGPVHHFHTLWNLP